MPESERLETAEEEFNPIKGIKSDGRKPSVKKRISTGYNYLAPSLEDFGTSKIKEDADVLEAIARMKLWS